MFVAILGLEKDKGTVLMSQDKGTVLMSYEIQKTGSRLLCLAVNLFPGNADIWWDKYYKACVEVGIICKRKWIL